MKALFLLFYAVLFMFMQAIAAVAGETAIVEVAVVSANGATTTVKGDAAKPDGLPFAGGTFRLRGIDAEVELRDRFGTCTVTKVMMREPRKLTDCRGNPLVIVAQTT